MHKHTINQLIDAAVTYDSKLECDYKSREEDALYDGKEPNKVELECSYLDPLLLAAKETEKAVCQARKNVRAAIGACRQSKTISRWLYKPIGIRTSLSVGRLPDEVLHAYQSYRTTMVQLSASKAKRREMLSNIVQGPLAKTIDEEIKKASARHTIVSSLKQQAVIERAKIEAKRQKLKQIINWLTKERGRFDRNRALTDHASGAAEAWIDAVKTQSQCPRPVLRIEPNADDDDSFRRIAQGVRGAWIDQMPGLMQAVGANSTAIHNALVKIGIPVSSNLDGSLALKQMWDALEFPHSFDPNVMPLLYWVASAAEVAMIRELTAKTDEEPLTTLLLSKLRESSEMIGTELFQTLGYGKDFPFHIASYDTDKVTEAEVGADFGLILQIGLEDQVICRAALLQAKLAKNGRTNIYRRSGRGGE